MKMQEENMLIEIRRNELQASEEVVQHHVKDEIHQEEEEEIILAFKEKEGESDPMLIHKFSS